MHRRDFFKGVVYSLGGVATYVASQGSGHEMLRARYPAIRVKGGDPEYRFAMVKYNGDFLGGAFWGDTGKGEAEVLVTTSEGHLVLYQSDLMTHILKGKVEIWAMPGYPWPHGKWRKTFVRKIPFGAGYYRIWEYAPESIEKAERLA